MDTLPVVEIEEFTPAPISIKGDKDSVVQMPSFRKTRLTEKSELAIFGELSKCRNTCYPPLLDYDSSKAKAVIDEEQANKYNDILTRKYSDEFPPYICPGEVWVSGRDQLTIKLENVEKNTNIEFVNYEPVKEEGNFNIETTLKNIYMGRKYPSPAISIDECVFQYKDIYGDLYIYCIIKRVGMWNLPARGFGKTTEEAFTDALKLNNKVMQIAAREPNRTIPKPEKNPYRGFKSYMFGELEMRFAEYAGFPCVITGITRKDENNFYYLEEPVPVDEKRYFKVVDNKIFHNREMPFDNSWLKEGEELYQWDDIRPMSGTCGLAIVKDGMLIKTKVYGMS